MDLNDYWQENKRFLVTAASGVCLFVIGTMVIDSLFRDELVAQKRTVDSTSSKLRNEAMYTSADLDLAARENEELEAAVAELAERVAFEPRPAFRFDAQKGSASNHYFATVSAVREELLTLAGRANLKLPEDLGLPALSPTREAEIARYLEALDVIDRAARLALATSVDRIDKIDIKLDPKLSSRQGVGAVERTRVTMTLSGRPTPMVQFVRASQRPDPSASPATPSASSLTPSKSPLTPGKSPLTPGKSPLTPGASPLTIEKLEMLPRGKGDAHEATLEVVFVAARLNLEEPGAEGVEQ